MPRLFYALLKIYNGEYYFPENIEIRFLEDKEGFTNMQAISAKESIHSISTLYSVTVHIMD